MLSIENLIRGVAEKMGGRLEADEGFYHLTVPVIGEDDEEVDPDHTQTATLYAEGEAEELLMVYCEAGAYTEEVDLEYILRGLKDAAFARVFITTGEEDDEPDGLAVEAALLREGLGVEHLAEVVQEVVNVADFVEDVIEGGAA
ncbi:MAG TPA: hypothetical protein VGQ83_42035 [Polyangia bacterium]